jgi:4-hydroxybenzoate polyprenyltransferase
MDLSFQEKSLWLMLIGLAVAFCLYFASALPVQSENVLPHQIVTFAALVVLLVVSQVVGHIVLAAFDRRHGTDERDRLIRLKGSRNGAYVLAAGVFVSICLALWIEGNFIFTHVLLAFWVAAQLIEIGSQLVLYRTGA